MLDCDIDHAIVPGLEIAIEVQGIISISTGRRYTVPVPMHRVGVQIGVSLTDSVHEVSEKVVVVDFSISPEIKTE